MSFAPRPAGLERVVTPQGEKDLYDAVSACSRCGYCEQACPTYVVTGQESHNPRGRNQVVRMLLEGKLKDKASAQEALSTCLLCGACSSACYAAVPTAELALEGRRRLQRAGPGAAARLVTWLLERPGLLAVVLKAAHLAKRLGLARLASLLRLPHLLGLGALARAEAHVKQAPLRFLHEELGGLEGRNWSYFAACGTDYLFPRVGRATVAALTALEGEGRFFGKACCGLAAYNYGDLEKAREFAKAAIMRSEAMPSGPVVVDCSSCAAHLKKYEQLFLEDEAWRLRSRALALRVRDVLELLPAAVSRARARLPEDVRVTYHDSCRARHGEGLWREPRDLLRSLLGSRYVELPEADFCCGGAGAYAFTQPELSDAVARRKVSNIAGAQADLVLTSSTSCLLQLEDALAKYYPEARVQHLSEFVAEHLAEPASDT